MSLLRREFLDLPLQTLLNYDTTHLREHFNRFLNERVVEWPAMNVKETREGMVVSVEVPGLHSDNVNVSLQDDLLTISGQRNEETVEEKEHFHRRERRYGSFARTVPVYPGTRPEHVSASNINGVLVVKVQRPENLVQHSGNIPISYAE